MVLYIGLSLALLAVDKLFNAHINGKVYLRLLIIIAGLFNTWFFLSGVPKNVSDISEKIIYPKGLKVFTQFVLIPLISIYLVILYAYMFKIIFTWNIPKGWVSYLVLCF